MLILMLAALCIAPMFAQQKSFYFAAQATLPVGCSVALGYTINNNTIAVRNTVGTGRLSLFCLEHNYIFKTSEKTRLYTQCGIVLKNKVIHASKIKREYASDGIAFEPGFGFKFILGKLALNVSTRFSIFKTSAGIKAPAQLYFGISK